MYQTCCKIFLHLLVCPGTLAEYLDINNMAGIPKMNFETIIIARGILITTLEVGILDEHSSLGYIPARGLAGT